jgi:hypothetical protein
LHQGTAPITWPAIPTWANTQHRHAQDARRGRTVIGIDVTLAGGQAQTVAGLIDWLEDPDDVGAAHSSADQSAEAHE